MWGSRKYKITNNRTLFVFNFQDSRFSTTLIGWLGLLVGWLVGFIGGLVGWLSRLTI